MESLGETLCFGRYRLHPTQGLRAGKREIRITPKSLSVLHALAARAGQIVSKEELFRVVWPKSVVSDATLTSSIKELRRALHDDAQAPRYIETVHRRGFRFIPPITRGESPSLTTPVVPAASCVGRDAVLLQLQSTFALASAGNRQLALVTGEPGIGKTALTHAFQQRMLNERGCVIARTECVQHYGASEAYQPLLEILTRLARSPLRRELIPALRRFAPLWLAQLPALHTAADARTLAPRTTGATPERMLRELTDVLEELSRRMALILCIEDLHWSDRATLDWLSCFARRPEPARVLIIGTCRSGEATVTLGLLEQLAAELQTRDLCKAIELAPLDENAVVTYVMQRFAPARGEEHAMQALARTVHMRTEGNPLFCASVLDELVARRALVDCDGSWRLEHAVSVSELTLPPDLRQTMQQQIGRLDPDARALLEVASLLAGNFAAATVAAGAGMPALEAERRLATLARSRTLVRRTGSTQWPDGTVTATFELVHALYADALRETLSPGQCVELHRAVGLRLEAAFGAHASRLAGELALHFDEGRDFHRAIRFHELAARNNLRLSSHQSAHRHFARALELLQYLEPSTLRDELEIGVQLGLGNVLMQTDGWAAPDVQAAYARATDLCQKQGAPQRLFPALWNLWVFSTVSGGLDRAQVLATQLYELACTSSDPASMLQAHHANWATLYSRGDLPGCAAHTRDGMQLYQLHRADDGDLEYGSHDCGVCARMFSARTLALFGESENALRHLDDGIALAEQLAHPFTRAFALTHAAAICLELDDPLKCREYGAAARAVAREWQFPLLDAWAACYMGASLAQLDEAATGLAMISDGIDRARAMGSEMFQPHLFGLLADVHLRNRSAEDGLRCVSEGLAISARTGERFYLAELHRIKGELHRVHGAGHDGRLEAESEFRKALAIAHSQHASLPAARTTTALQRL
jgi:DNA-binding winged helix-turn-helix (wHTH) protein/predicted ATPase